MRLITILIGYALFSSALWAEERPMFQLDTGGHMALINGLAFTPDGKFIVSAGHDKVIRIWNWSAHRTVRTIRGQSGQGEQGKIFALAVSPDGHWLAVAGFMAQGHGVNNEAVGDIRIYDFGSGKLKVLLKGHSDAVLGLAFSRNGKRLISGGADQEAIIWDIGSLSKANTTTEPPTTLLLCRLKGHRAKIYAVGLSPDGTKAVTGSYDKTVRLWNVADGGLIRELTGHAEKVRSLAVSPNNGIIASGDNDGEIRIWHPSGTFMQSIRAPSKGIGFLSFSADGRTLAAASGTIAGKDTVTIYETKHWKRTIKYLKHDNIVLGGAFSPDGNLIATAGGKDFEIHVWDPNTGKTMSVLKGSGRPNRAVAFYKDEHKIAWGNTPEYSDHNRRGLLEMAMRLPSLNTQFVEPEPVTSQAGWRRANATFGEWSLKHRNGGSYGFGAILELRKNGRPVGAVIERGPSDGYDHRSYSFTPDGKQIISGAGNGWLSLYNLKGERLGDFVGHEGDVWAVTPSPDGRYLVSGSSDQTVRLWNLKTRELLVSVFQGIDGEWVMWTPQGYYTGSPGADRIIGWQINKGLDKAADYVTAEQLRKHLNRPDIVAKAIYLASAEEAVRTSYGTDFKLSDLFARPVPRLVILSPTAESVLKSEAITAKVKLGRTRDPVKRVRIQVNGRQLDDFLPKDAPSFAPGEHEFPVALTRGINTIIVTALNEIGWSKVEEGTVTLTNERVGSLDKRGTLYLVAVGVTKYPGIRSLCPNRPNCDLNYTGNDATAFANEMEKRFGALHEKVVRRVLVNEGKSDGVPTAANIINALGLLQNAQANDTVAVFLAGHGFNQGPNYRFVSTDAALSDGRILPATIVPWYAIEEAIDFAKGRRLLFIDTCHSANAYNARLANAAYHANILAYSSARWDQLAWEHPAYAHGLFTQAIIEGLAGSADMNRDDMVYTYELSDYIQTRVAQLAAEIKGTPEQDPQFFKGRDAEDYALAALRSPPER